MEHLGDGAILLGGFLEGRLVDPGNGAGDVERRSRDPVPGTKVTRRRDGQALRRVAAVGQAFESAIEKQVA